MRKVLQIGIDNPCSENWAAFPKVRDGFMLKGHCQSCNKEVIDFTTWSDEKIKEFFQHKPQRICGRLRPSQVKDYQLQAPGKPSRPGILSYIFAAWFLLTSKNLEAQTIAVPPPEIEWFYVAAPSYPEKECAEEEICIRGNVLFADDNSLGVGTHVVQKGTSNGTTVGENGTFSLPLQNPGKSVILIFSFIDYETREITITKENYQQELNTVMIEVDFLMGDVIIGRTISPRRWWWGFKGLFSRKGY